MQGYYYVYILRSLVDPQRHYTGLTQDLHRRLMEHNSGNVHHTAQFKPWKIKTDNAFEDIAAARQLLMEHSLPRPAEGFWQLRSFALN